MFDNLLVAEKLNEDMKPEATRYLQRLIKLGRRAGTTQSLQYHMFNRYMVHLVHLDDLS